MIQFTDLTWIDLETRSLLSIWMYGSGSELSWIASPGLMMADWIACRLTAMSVLVAVFSYQVWL